MANFRVEAELDGFTGKYRSKIFYPCDAKKPVATTSAIYETGAEAVRCLEEMFRGAFEAPKREGRAALRAVT